MDDDLRDRIEDALKGHDARLIEVRVEQGEGTHIRYRGKELDEIGHTTGVGGCIRALAGGWGFASFNGLEGLKEKVATAVRNAHLVSDKGINLAPVDPVVDSVPPLMGKDPLSIPLQDKKALLDQYVDIIWSVPQITTSTIGYGDGRRKRVFATSEGTYIQQEKIDVSLRLNAMARDGGDVQQSGVSLGSNGDFSFVEQLHDDAGELAQRAVDLIKAPQAKGGEYTVVLDPVLAGVFIHEAFGHLSEADHVYEDQRLRDMMKMGRRFGGPHINVVDGAAVPSLRGSYKYDDEGVPATRTSLLKEGVLVGRLHSRETAATMGETPTGNARAISSQFPPIVRMTNTFIEPGSATFEDIISDIKEGLYVCNWYGGMTSMEQFTFSAGEAYAIRIGKVEELMRPVLLSGNLFTTMQNLDAIANDLDMNQGGGCGKGGQSPLPVSNGSPHIRIQKCLIGGTSS
ncbi:MAG: TldD/PmbA family protein [Dehalococcoidia bacterium]|nr:TldD/PmbA family protein [Dehalococcoidia bacterium]